MKTRTVQLACDDCGTIRQAQPGVSMATLREALAAVGWLSDHANDTDRCPACLARRAGW